MFLDYPPFFAYFEYILGNVATFFDKDMLQIDNLNFQSESTILFQRLSVIFSEFLTLPFALYFFDTTNAEQLVFLILFSPGLIFVDNIHFQYNGFLYGILLFSVVALKKKSFLIGGFLFAIVLNFKHIYLYQAPAYFIYLLSAYCWKANGTFSISNLIKIGVTTVSTFVISFAPFYQQIPQILSRLFPFKRGLCHAYWAPNFWALYSFADRILLKTFSTITSSKVYSQPSLTRGLIGDSNFQILPNITPIQTVILTLTFQIPTLYKLFTKPTYDNFLDSLVLCGFSSFFFGWHVHEKAILLVIIPFRKADHEMFRFSKFEKIYLFFSVIVFYVGEIHTFKSENFLQLLLYSVYTALGMSLELSLLENVEMRIALADTDAKLETNLRNFLDAVLLKLDSKNPQVKNKVMEICTHINKRIKSNNSIKIPVNEILEIFVRKDVSLVVHNFALIYIEMGFQRLSDNEAINLLPTITNRITERPESQQIVLFGIILSTISKFPFSMVRNSPEAKWDPLKLLHCPNESNFLLRKFTDFMLYSCPPVRPLSASTVASNAINEDEFVPVGLSKAKLNFVSNNKKATFCKNPQELKVFKLSVLRFLNAAELFPETQFPNLRFLVFLVATGDTAHEVVGAGDDGIRRLKTNFEDPELIEEMYSIYQGSPLTESNQAQKRTPCGITLKSKILTYLLKSVSATNKMPNMIQVSFDSLYGENSNLKLKTLGMSFVQWIAKMASLETLQPVAPFLLSGMLKYINESTEVLKPEDETVRGFAYEAIGLLSKRVKSVFAQDISIVKLFFDALSNESRNVKVSVQDSLTMMAEAYKDSKFQKELELMLLNVVERPDSSSKFVAAKFCNTIFPFCHSISKVVCLIASSDSKLEVKEEAKKGLKFPVVDFSSTNTVESEEYKKKLPTLDSMVNLLHRRLNKSPPLSTSKAEKYLGGLTVETYSKSVEFLRKLIVIAADPVSGYKSIITAEEFGGGPNSEENAIVMNNEICFFVKKYLNELWNIENSNSVEIEYSEVSESNTEVEKFGVKGYLDLVEMALLSPESDPLLQATASSCLKELISLSPSSLCKEFYSKLELLKPLIFGLKMDTRINISNIFALVSSNELELIPSRRTDFVSYLNFFYEALKDESKPNFSNQHGSIVALGFLISRLLYRYFNTWYRIVSQAFISDIISLISKNLDHKSSIIVVATCNSLAEIGRYTLLPMQEKLGNDNEGKVAEKMYLGVKDILEKLFFLVKNSKEVKVQEAAIYSLGHIAIGSSFVADSDLKLQREVLDFFFTLAPLFSKQVEIHFSIGEALCTLSGGLLSTQMSSYLDISDVKVDIYLEKSLKHGVLLIKEVVEKIITELSNLTVSVVVKKSYCVWLLSFTKFLGNHEGLKPSLKEIHRVFSLLLAERDEFTQDVASKGIGLVYELGDEVLKKELVNELVSTLTEGKKIAPQSLAPETQLFQENAMGNSPDGSQLTTYQSILSLASDMNQPDMVYKFVQMASHSAVWNSRRGASLGFGSIMNTSLSLETESHLKPYMSTLIPRLYRFQFDPNGKVADSMKNIWKSLVKEPKKCIDEYFDLIIKDLLKGQGDRLWRTREACSTALGELLHGREISQIEPYLQEIWIMCFRTLDDIKESVRVAALGTCKSLTNLTVRYCDPSNVSVNQGQKIIDIVLPFFLSKGLFNMSEDVRSFSLNTVLKISKKGGVLLKPHLPELVVVLLEGLTTLEPQVMNYLSFHTDKYSFSQEQLDSTRLTAAKHSPIMEAVESSINQLDGAVLDLLVPKLSNLIRKAVGLPTKAGCARYVISLAMHNPLVLKPFADDLLKALSGVVWDRSIAVRKSFSAAAAYIANLSTDAAMSRFIRHLKKIYIESDQVEIRSITPLCFQDLTKHANDKIKNYKNEVLPLSFFGSRDSNPEIKDHWKNVLEDLAGGSTTSAAKLYVDEIVELSSSILSQSPSWPVKKQVGKTFSELSELTETEFYKKMNVVVPLLCESLSGRTWEGKESVLEALCNICINCKNWFDDDSNSEQLTQVCMVAVREMKKNNKSYKRFALDFVGKLFNALDVDKYEEIQDYLCQMATGDDLSVGESMDVDEIRERPMNLLIQANAFRALGRFFPSSELATQEKYSEALCKFLCENVEENVWNVRVAVLDSMELFINKLIVNKTTLTPEMISFMLKGILKALEDQKYTIIREKATVVLRALVNKSSGCMSDDEKINMKEKIKGVIEKEKVASISEELRKILL
ncbi:hypothetical protein HDU92_000075 [Lobulomyces angularis]|nr:hypothetical protein HDU92_000075 [Lobulomyces angularis]